MIVVLAGFRLRARAPFYWARARFHWGRVPRCKTETNQFQPL